MIRQLSPARSGCGASRLGRHGNDSRTQPHHRVTEQVLKMLLSDRQQGDILGIGEQQRASGRGKALNDRRVQQPARVRRTRHQGIEQGALRVDDEPRPSDGSAAGVDRLPVLGRSNRAQLSVERRPLRNGIVPAPVTSLICSVEVSAERVTRTPAHVCREVARNLQDPLCQLVARHAEATPTSEMLRDESSRRVIRKPHGERPGPA